MKQWCVLTLILIFADACVAQEKIIIQSKGKQQWPTEDVQKIYLSSCAAVQREYGSSHTVQPQITLVLGAEKDELMLESREIRLKKWDGFLFSQGVVVLAFLDLMPLDRRLTIAKRAIGWADATVNISQLGK